MNRLNNNILVGQAKSKARFNNAQYVCATCLNNNLTQQQLDWYEFNIGRAEYCECCERPVDKCSMTGYLITDVKKF